MTVKKGCIITFIGNTDLKYYRGNDVDNMSPIDRFFEEGFLERHKEVDWTLLLLNDKPGEEQVCDKKNEGRESLSRNEFIERIADDYKNDYPNLVVKGVPIHSVKHNPSDHQALFDEVWGAIPHKGKHAPDEYAFILTSGTPAMISTLLLASCSLTSKKTSAFQVDKHKGIEEVILPYKLALKRDSKKRPPDLFFEKEIELRKKQIVIYDSVVKLAYIDLFLSLSTVKKGVMPRVMIAGAVGTGKTTAANILLDWLRGLCKSNSLDFELIEISSSKSDVFERFILDEPDKNKRILIKANGFDEWSGSDRERFLDKCTTLSDNVGVLITGRSELLDHSGIDLKKILGDGQVNIYLPKIEERSDIFDLVLVHAQQRAYTLGKLYERSNYSLFTKKEFSRGCYTLFELVDQAYKRSPSIHIQDNIMESISDEPEARRILHESISRVYNKDYSQYKLEKVLSMIKASSCMLAVIETKNQDEAGILLGGHSKQFVSDNCKAFRDYIRINID